MKNVVIWGSTDTGKCIYENIKNEENVIAFLDEDYKKIGSELCGIKIFEPDDLIKMEYDYIYVGVLTYYEEVMKHLQDMKIPEYKIVDKYVALPTKARVCFLESVYEMLKSEGISEGSVAELGVYKGNYAKEINRVFSNNRLYLFDTFEGFKESDDRAERERGFHQIDRTGYFSDTSPEHVLGLMPNRDQCVVRPGFFPDTAKGLENEHFLFVNIDVDLYEPILAGLEWFYPRMVPGGVLLVHDYFSKAFTGARVAVERFAQKMRIRFLPVGDTLSVALRIY